MTPQLFQYRSELPSAVDEVFAWHERPGALERLTPPWEKVSVVQRSGTICDGDRVTLSMEICRVPITWIAEHRDYQPGRQFRDVQIRGPFARWEHLHRFEPVADDRTIAEDRIEYVLPGGRWGQRLGAGSIDRKLRRAFRYRHDILAADLAAHAPFRDLPRLTVALSGSSGLIGSALAAYLNSGGHQVKRLIRSAPGRQPDEMAWNPASGEVDWTGIDAVVHLAGESVAARWTPAKKARIRDSRVIATERLARSLARAARPPGVLVCASAIGFYGNRGDEEL
ncbi:MAG: NAD-dependent epimerase/dehydratase family protein, partial [Thermoguttaceae bacterium]|nr:NAD-dependent epimerase/dehydratase family protein [Thermoguttaceae bacterium]